MLVNKRDGSRSRVSGEHARGRGEGKTVWKIREVFLEPRVQLCHRATRLGLPRWFLTRYREKRLIESVDSDRGPVTGL